MDIGYDDLFNRVLDVSSLIHIPLKIFTMYVVLKYTPKDHCYHSYFILNVMFWNFMCGLIFAFWHVTPLFPAECFRLDGRSTLPINNDSFGQVIFLAELVALSNCGVAIVLSFPYRYIVFAFPHFSPKPVWTVLLCGGVHMFFNVMFLPLYVHWTVSYDDYPEKVELPDRAFAFCFYPHGYRKTVPVLTYMVMVIVGSTVAAISTRIFLSGIRANKRAYHTQIIALQKKLFNSLIIINVIALLFAGIPLLIAVITAYLPHLPYSSRVCMVCIVFLCNHGSINSVAYLMLFKAYRDAVKRLVLNFIGSDGRWNVQIAPVHTSTPNR